MFDHLSKKSALQFGLKHKKMDSHKNMDLKSELLAKTQEFCSFNMIIT